MTKTATLIFPHQLFKQHPAFAKKPDTVVLVQHSLFFYDNSVKVGFHRQKILLHVASMQAYAASLKRRGFDLRTIEWQNGECVLGSLCKSLANEKHTEILVADPCDFLLQKRLSNACAAAKLKLTVLDTPGFLNSNSDNAGYRSGKKRWFMADYYRWQRQRLNVLMDADQPVGGQWSFDEDNRKKLPIKQLPLLTAPAFPKWTDKNRVVSEQSANAIPHQHGESTRLFYPVTHKQAEAWLDDFLQNRFHLFGDYEDAIEQDQNWLYHSVLTPMMNIGLLEPQQVVEKALEIAKENKVPQNSVEGFVRQVIGWREFMRATYADLGVPMRTTNHWQHNRAMPKAFYTGTTGIDPVDNAIHRIIQTGYCHHIERLMVLGGFMFLCEIDPDDIYQWFMELFVDSYDWVMVPNVYAMSQHADGGAITTKPYFSGSNYVIKMSHYKKGSWSDIWDSLFWRWIHKNRIKLAKNHRWSMMCKNLERMDATRLRTQLSTADAYLAQL